MAIDTQHQVWKFDNLKSGTLYKMPSFASKYTHNSEYTHNSLVEDVIKKIESPGYHYLKGPSGMGKTVALSVAAAYVKENKWFLVYFLRANQAYEGLVGVQDSQMLRKAFFRTFLANIAEQNEEV